MAEAVLVPVPVSRGAAEILGDEAKRRRLGKPVNDLLRPTSPEKDPLAALIAEAKAEAATDGLTDEEIDTELAAYNAEGRVRRQLAGRCLAGLGAGACAAAGTG